MNLSEASKKEIDVVLGKCGWRQTKQRVILLKSIFDGKDKHFSINQMNETLKDNRSYFSPVSYTHLTLPTILLV